MQPSELAKLAIIFFVAAVPRAAHGPDRRPALRAAAHRHRPGRASALILLQPDLGTAVSIIAIVGAMVFAAGINYRYIVGLLLVSLPGAYVVLMSAD